MESTIPHTTIKKAAQMARAMARLVTRPETERRTVEFMVTLGWSSGNAQALADELEALTVRYNPEWHETEKAMTLKVAAEYTGLRYARIFNLANQGKIRAHKERRSRRWLVHADDLEKWKKK